MAELMQKIPNLIILSINLNEYSANLSSQTPIVDLTAWCTTWNTHTKKLRQFTIENADSRPDLRPLFPTVDILEFMNV